MNLSQASYFIIGIKGVAMANIASILKHMGATVTGSDTEDPQPTDALLDHEQIPWTVGFDTADIPQDTDVIIYAAAHGGTHNPQVVEGKKRGITILHQMDIISEFVSMSDNSIAVCGCHGKTTTTSLLAYTLENLGVNPSWLVGAPNFMTYRGGVYNDPKYFVVEADEYGKEPPHDKTPKLLFLHPTHTLCLNIDYDHPDVYTNIEETKKTFLQFFQQTQKTLIFCADDIISMEVAKELENKPFETYGFNPFADLTVSNVKSSSGKTEFTGTYKGKDIGSFAISLFGEKNVSNTTGVILMLLKLGFEPDKIREAVRDFTGAKRRFELVHVRNDTWLFDDYGHHPHEIEATVQAMRSRFPDKRVILIFQPHTYSRTVEMKDEFVQALAKADYSLLLPIFGSAREQENTTISSEDIVLKAHRQQIEKIILISSEDELTDKLRELIKPGDVLCTMGAGDVYKHKDAIIPLIDNL